MISNRAAKRYITSELGSAFTDLAKELLKSRAGTAPAELAFLLGFVAMVAVTGVVFVGDSVANSLIGVSDRVEVAATNMPNPLGGSGTIIVSGGGSEGGGNNGGGNNGGGNGNGKNK